MPIILTIICLLGTTLGKGGFAKVFLANELDKNRNRTRHVAIKVRLFKTFNILIKKLRSSQKSDWEDQIRSRKFWKKSTFSIRWDIQISSKCFQAGMIRKCTAWYWNTVKLEVFQHIWNAFLVEWVYKIIKAFEGSHWTNLKLKDSLISSAIKKLFLGVFFLEANPFFDQSESKKWGWSL